MLLVLLLSMFGFKFKGTLVRRLRSDALPGIPSCASMPSANRRLKGLRAKPGGRARHGGSGLRGPRRRSLLSAFSPSSPRLLPSPFPSSFSSAPASAPIPSHSLLLCSTSFFAKPAPVHFPPHRAVCRLPTLLVSLIVFCLPARLLSPSSSSSCSCPPRASNQSSKQTDRQTDRNKPQDTEIQT